MSPYVSLGINIACALGHCSLGLFTHSWWLITLGAYYAVLAVTRFSVLRIRRKDLLFAKRLTGILLLVLSVCIMGINILSAVQDRGTAFHKIIMIAIATFTFTKITLAIIGMINARHSTSPSTQTLRNISLADACVSIYAMQRSMLVSFPGMSMAEIRIFNILTGTAVYITVLLLGVNLIGGKRTAMAKSKIAKVGEKISDSVVSGYKIIEDGVVSGYKKIEGGVVSGYTKIEDKFVDAFLTKDNETVEEAKARLKKDSK